jgi:transposase
MDRQTLRDWVHRYNTEGLAGLRSCKPPGPFPKLTAQQKAELAALVEAGPDPAQHGWCAGGGLIYATRLSDASAERSVGKVLAKLGYRRLSVRPRHPQADQAAQATFFAATGAAALPRHAQSKPPLVLDRGAPTCGRGGRSCRRHPLREGPRSFLARLRRNRIDSSRRRVRVRYLLRTDPSFQTVSHPAEQQCGQDRHHGNADDHWHVSSFARRHFGLLRLCFLRAPGQAAEK